MQERKRLIIVVAAAAIIVLMGLFPPWKSTYEHAERPEGYSFFLSPPSPARFRAKIDTTRLFLQLFLVVIVAGAAHYYVSSLEKFPRQNTPQQDDAPQELQTGKPAIDQLINELNKLGKRE